MRRRARSSDGDGPVRGDVWARVRRARRARRARAARAAFAVAVCGVAIGVTGAGSGASAEPEVMLDVDGEQGKVSGTLTAELPLSETTRLQVGVGFGGSLGEIEAFDTDVAALSFAQTFRGGAGTVRAGKAAYRLGRGRVGTLLSNGDMPGYPSIAYSLTGERSAYTKILGDLAGSPDTYKRLGLHYFSYRLTPQLEVGAAEVHVRTDPFPGDFFYDLVPGLPYYLAKYLPGVATSTDNDLIYLDAEIGGESFAAYGEFLANEFPMPGKNNTPLYGVLAGAEIGVGDGGSLVAEYARLTNYAYSNGQNGEDGTPDAVYSYGGRPLGHTLGSDGDALTIRWARPMSSGWTLQLGAFAERKGEGELASWSDASTRRENAFLSGVVERTVGLIGGIERELDGLRLYGEVRFGRVANEGHKLGEDGFTYEMSAGLKLGAYTSYGGGEYNRYKDV